MEDIYAMKTVLGVMAAVLSGIAAFATAMSALEDKSE